MKRNGQAGVALMGVILIMALLSALLIGFTATVASDAQQSGITRDQSQAYAAAHAGVEKITADLGQLFTTNFAPSGAQIAALTTNAHQPQLPGIQFAGPNGTPGYQIRFTDTNNDGNPDVENPAGSTISSGPYQGLMGLITPYEIDVAARTTGRAEVRMRRTMQTIAIPVFQFGIFSNNDLSFHANGYYAFGGRVHSNANIFLSSVNGTDPGILTLSDRVTAVGEIIRQFFANGRSTTAAGYTGTIRMARAPGCPAAPTAANANCRNLAMNEGSVVGDVGSAANANWPNLSVGTYNQYIRNGFTGARRLDLPLVSDGATPVDLIRRPVGVENASLAGQRFYNLASLRILLSDTAAEITALPGVVGTPVSLEVAQLAAAAGSWQLAKSTGLAANGYRSAANTPLLGGFILINKQATNGTWTDVTNEILALGITGRNLAATCADPHADAIVRLQRVKDTPATSPSCGSGATTTLGTDYWPNAIYDPREGLRRDNETTSQNEMYLGGIMHYVEFDVNNYRRWLAGSIGASGAGSQNTTGFVVYFSDRRGNKNAANVETGEYGWEDFINSDGVSTPNGTLQAGEDMNGSTTLETYGNTPRFPAGYTVVAPSGSGTYGTGSPINATSNVHTSRVNYGVARANRAVFFRRALKLVNGGLGQLPSNGLQGLTVASENPVYVQGNYNACGLPTATCASNGFGPTGDNHRSAAIIADSVTLLSRNWNDRNSFTSPHNPTGRTAATTWYRMGVISGKGLNFPFPNNNASDPANFGSDGGAHNFLRFLEDWGTTATVNYRGSMISLFISRQAVGTWKCCQNVYNPPERAVAFDEEFLQPTLLPPRTPMFRDLNTLTFRQILRPTQ